MDNTNILTSTEAEGGLMVKVVIIYLLLFPNIMSLISRLPCFEIPFIDVSIGITSDSSPLEIQ